MMETKYLTFDDGRRLAYQLNQGTGPVIVFLSGHGSDMFGSKAEALADYCLKAGRAFLRFDYTGHGLSSGAFLDGTISSWTKDATDILEKLADDKVILVGSSLGGWIMLNLAKANPHKMAGLIGIAAAPDFTETLIWQNLSADQQEEMAQTGQIALPNPYADEDVIYPYTLITDGRDNLLLDKPLDITCSIILHQGMADHEVPWQTACAIAEVVSSDNVHINLVKASGHRFSSDEEIAMIIHSLESLLADPS